MPCVDMTAYKILLLLPIFQKKLWLMFPLTAGLPEALYVYGQVPCQEVASKSLMVSAIARMSSGFLRNSSAPA